jgi:hypothetical protein
LLPILGAWNLRRACGGAGQCTLPSASLLKLEICIGWESLTLENRLEIPTGKRQWQRQKGEWGLASSLNDNSHIISTLHPRRRKRKRCGFGGCLSWRMNRQLLDPFEHHYPDRVVEEEEEE